MNTKPFHAALLVTVCLLAATLFSGCGEPDRPADGEPDVTTSTTHISTTTTTTATTATTTTTTVSATTVAAAPTATQNTSPGENSDSLDPTYSRLLLVNAEHPLPEDFDYTGNLTEIDAKYLNGSLNQIDKDIYPYVKAMVDAAWADGVKLYVRSPYRSYNTQRYLFNNKVQKVIASGTPADQAEAVAATAVARPGTSEHHTGLAIDFNVADSEFEQTPMFDWLMEHGEDYGFILRYPADKTAVTGIMYESWHWRFVGINTAREINQLGVTLEEYLNTKAQQ